MAKDLYVIVSLLVAPLTGAWIETNARCLAVEDRPVAPLTGAWIETR